VLAGLGTFAGQAVKNGVALAVAEIEATSGRPLNVEVADIKNETDPVLAQAAFRRLIEDHGVTAVIGPSRDEALLGILPEIPRLKKPVLTIGAGASGTSLVAQSYESFKYLFRVGLHTNWLAYDVAQFARDYLYENSHRGRGFRSVSSFHGCSHSPIGGERI